MLEIRRMIETGELTLDALKWKVRKDGATDSTGTSSIIKSDPHFLQATLKNS
jgi:hypothetical protein